MRPEQREPLEDFALRPVPLDKRRPWIDLAMVWIGVAIVLSALLRGMMIGMGLGTPGRVLLAYLLGEMLLIGMMTLTGYLGARHGLATPLLVRESFGMHGGRLISFCLAFAFMGWFGIQAGLFARTLTAVWKVPFPVAAIALISGLLMMIPAVFGFQGLRALSWVAVPPMLILFILAAVRLGFHFLPEGKLVALALSHSPSPYPVSLGAAASIIAGGFIVGAVTSADVFRYARPRLRDVLFAAALSMAVSALMQLAGSTLAMTTGLYHEELPRLLISREFAGLGVLGFTAIALAQWTTNDSNLYSSVLAFKNLIEVERWKLAIGVGVLASLLAAWGILERLGLFLSLLSIGIGPIGGILIADQYLLRGRRRAKRGQSGRRISAPPTDSATQPRWNSVALIVYAVSVLVGWTTAGHPFRIPVFPFSIFAFNGILTAVMLYWAGMTALSRRQEKKNKKIG